MARHQNLIGRKFGRLTVIFLSPNRKADNHKAWMCKCDCGVSATVGTNLLTTGRTKSCGCFRRESARISHTTHGQSRSTEYGIWANMIDRCTNEKNKKWNLYGGRGIVVCKEWLVFENFSRDMGPRPSPKHSLDRVDTNGNYEPNNCRWATWNEQHNNRRNNIRVTFNGQLVTISEACGIAKTKTSRKIVMDRVLRGWDIEKAMSTPALVRTRSANGQFAWREAPEMVT